MPTRHAVAGIHRVPGDKSITHRALLFASLAAGRSEIRGALTSLDARSSARVLRQLGASISPLRQGITLHVTGRRRFTAPPAPLDCGNSGTTARLLLGLLAAHRFPATVTGDPSLRRRPMRRVTLALAAMGATVDDHGHDGLPLTIRGGQLRAISWDLPVVSAQVKSALLLAAAVGGVEITLTEPAATRDHTERLLRHFGYGVVVRDRAIQLRPTGRIEPFAIDIPGDPSSAAFLVAAASLASEGEIRVAGVGLNPTRTGFLSVMRRMGASLETAEPADAFGEPTGTLIARAGALTAVVVSPGEVPGVIDEIPILACMAARAHGTSRFKGVGELRVKESDRLALLAQNLVRIGVRADVVGDDLHVTGTDAPLKGRIVTGGDHRIAMAFQVLGTVPGNRITVDDPECAAVSFPAFAGTLAGLFVGTGR